MCRCLCRKCCAATIAPLVLEDPNKLATRPVHHKRHHVHLHLGVCLPPFVRALMSASGVHRCEHRNVCGHEAVLPVRCTAMASNGDTARVVAKHLSSSSAKLTLYSSCIGARSDTTCCLTALTLQARLLRLCGGVEPCAAMSDKESSIAQFVGITNADAPQAEHLLEASGWDLDAAIRLFFEASAGASFEQDSEALVRQLVEQDAQEAPAIDASAGPSAAPTLDEDGVRNPDAVRTERLFDSPGGRFGVPRRSVRAPVDVGAELSDSQDAGLDAIYKPPRELMSDLSLAECGSSNTFCLLFMLWLRRGAHSSHIACSKLEFRVSCQRTTECCCTFVRKLRVQQLSLPLLAWIVVVASS